jgi:hypothetical protein
VYSFGTSFIGDFFFDCAVMSKCLPSLSSHSWQ